MNKRNWIKYGKYILVNILIAAIISVFLITYVASAYRIRGNSMNNVLRDRERIIISKLGVKSGHIERFDIVVLKKPDQPNIFIVKRVIGLPGEIIEIQQGEVYIDSRKITEPYLEGKKDVMYRTISLKPLLIKKDHYFVVGDNRPASVDSRDFGEVPIDYILGKAFLRYWPLSRFGKID